MYLFWIFFIFIDDTFFRTLGAAGIPQFSLAIQAFTNARAACYPAIIVMEQKSNSDCKPNHSKLARSTLVTSFSNTQRIGTLTKNAPSLKFSNICFDNISFSYPTRPDALVLDNFTFSLKSGQTIGIVGPSGSGVRQSPIALFLCMTVPLTLTSLPEKHSFITS